jgi:hypothetical protein
MSDISRPNKPSNLHIKFCKLHFSGFNYVESYNLENATQQLIINDCVIEYETMNRPDDTLIFLLIKHPTNITSYLTRNDFGTDSAGNIYVYSGESDIAMATGFISRGEIDEVIPNNHRLINVHPFKLDKGWSLTLKIFRFDTGFASQPYANLNIKYFTTYS